MDHWTEPHFKTSALITIDTQNDFLDDGPFPIAGTRAALPAIAALLRLYREKGLPIVHIIRLYLEDGSNVDLCRRAMVEAGRRMAAPGSAGSQLAAQLLAEPDVLLDPNLLLAGGVQRIGPAEVVIYKSRFGAFYQTPLEAHLRAAGVDTLVFSGCNYPNCPRTSMYEATERDFRVVLVKDALSGLYPKGEEEMAGVGVILMDAARIAEEVEKSSG